MSIHQHPTAALVPPAAVMRVLQRFERAELEGFIEVALGLLDTLDGDADIEDDDPHEADGDEQDGDFAEDEESTLAISMDAGAGCPISDSDIEHDGREEEHEL